MPFSVFKKLKLGEAKPTMVSLQIANRTIRHLRGVLENVLIKVSKLIFSADIIVLNMEKDQDIPIILGRPFFAMENAVISVPKGELSLKVENEKVTFNIFKALKDPLEPKACCQIVTVDKSVTEKNMVKAIEYLKEPEKASKVYF